jgi:hypothetical protein
MNWGQFDITSAFLILSIISSAGAASLLVYATIRARTRKSTYIGLEFPIQLYRQNEVGGQGWLSGVDAASSKKKLSQCPNCLMVDHAGARFCIRCGIPMQREIASPIGDTSQVEAQYEMQDGSTRVFGLSTWLNPETRLGVIVGIQRRGPLQSINET